jgi:hypothetical protein
MIFRNGSTVARPLARRRFRGRLRAVALAVLGMLVLWPYAITIGAAGGTFTLVNSTRYHLHARINSMPSVYIAPGRGVDYDAGGGGHVWVEVRYSPGQPVRGSITRTFEIIYHTQCSQKSAQTCSENSNDCSTTESESVCTVTPEPVLWKVTEEDFAPHGGGDDENDLTHQ